MLVVVVNSDRFTNQFHHIFLVFTYQVVLEMVLATYIYLPLNFTTYCHHSLTSLIFTTHCHQCQQPITSHYRHSLALFNHSKHCLNIHLHHRLLLLTFTNSIIHFFISFSPNTSTVHFQVSLSDTG